MKVKDILDRIKNVARKPEKVWVEVIDSEENDGEPEAMMRLESLCISLFESRRVSGIEMPGEDRIRLWIDKEEETGE